MSFRGLLPSLFVLHLNTKCGVLQTPPLLICGSFWAFAEPPDSPAKVVECIYQLSRLDDELG
jgi:hypothetical protein